MALKQMPIRITDEERELLDKLAEAEGLEVTNAIRLAIKEALEKRGIPVPDTAFGKKQEGRPKEDPPTNHSDRRAYSNTEVGVMAPTSAVSS
jgi:hypothetical protein